MPNFRLLTCRNPKTHKGRARGYITAVLHLAPARLSGYEVCRWRTKGCTALCLNMSGRAAIMQSGKRTNAIQECRKRRTKLFFEDRKTFLAWLVDDIEHLARYAEKRALVPAVRLNGTSDIVWESIACERNGVPFPSVFAAFPAIQFYDYTKAPYSARRHDIPNYHLTFSFAETVKNQHNAGEWLKNGHNMSVVFGIGKKQKLPRKFRGIRVFDADTDDLRFLDLRGVAGLRAKGNVWRYKPNDFIRKGRA